MKYFIFAMKCRTRKPNFAAFKNHLTMRIKLKQKSDYRMIRLKCTLRNGESFTEIKTFEIVIK